MSKGDGLSALLFGGGSLFIVIFVWLVSVAVSLGVLAAAVWVVIQVLKGTGVINP